MQTKNNIPVFCINLKRASERRARMVQEWTVKRGVDLLFFEAIDQKDIDISNLPEPFNTNFKESFSNPLKEKDLTIGEICCSISHAKVLEKIMEMGLNKAVVIEDDAEPLFENAEEFFANLRFFEEDDCQSGIILLHDQLENAKTSNMINDNEVLTQKFHYILTSKTTCTQSIYYKNYDSMVIARNAFSLLVNPTDWAWDHFNIAKSGILGLSINPLTSHLIDTTYIKHSPDRFFIKDELEIDEYNFFKTLTTIDSICCNEIEESNIVYRKEDINLEDYFCSIYKRHKEQFNEIGYYLIPIKWTKLLNDKKNRKELILRLKDEIEKLPKDKLYFTVSQHSNAPIIELLPPNTINFSAGGNVANCIPIPLISQNKNKLARDSTISTKKDIFCSFVGSVSTHSCRKKMVDVLSRNTDYTFCVKNDWSIDITEEQADLFESTAKRSKFTLCPRGYGPTSFRLYEAMEFGSIPVYICDNWHLPYKDIIDWNDICVLVSIEAIDNLDAILKSIPKTKYENMVSNIKRLFSTTFNFKYMFEYIFDTLKSNSATYNNTTPYKDDIPTKIFTYSTESHKVFMPWFKTIHTIYPNISIEGTSFDQDCILGAFGEQGWNITMLKKLDRIIELFDLYPDEKSFIFSDIDVQFFRPFHHITNRLLETYDILFQKDGNTACAGFMIFNNKNNIKELFQKAKERLIAFYDTGKENDQTAINYILKNEPSLNVTYKLLPKEFFNFSLYDAKYNNYQVWSKERLITSRIELPANIVMHHANWTVGIQAKMEMLKLVSNKVNSVKSNDKITIVTALIEGYHSTELIQKTANSIIPNLADSNAEWNIIYSDKTISKNLLEISNNNPKIKIIENTNTSLYGALNQALEYVEGGYVLFVEAGATMVKDSIKLIETTIKDNSNADGIYFKTTPHSKCLVSPEFQPFQLKLQDIHMERFMFNPCWVLKADYIKALGGFNTKYKISADYDLFCRYFFIFPNIITKNKKIINFLKNETYKKAKYEGWLESALIAYTNLEQVVEDTEQLMVDITKTYYELSVNEQKGVENAFIVDQKAEILSRVENYVFHIGLDKSGTRKLNATLNQLGIRSCHFADPLINDGKSVNKFFTNELQEENVIYLHRYPFKAYVNIDLFRKEYEWLYNTYPNAKFILTVRNKEDWLSSRLFHHIKLNNLHEDSKEAAGFLKYSSTLYDTHLMNVKRFFSDKKDKLLIVDFHNKDERETIREFLKISN